MIWWCVEHHAERYAFGAGGLTAFCWKAGREPEDAAISCRMVEALLIVKENGRWPERAVIKVAGTLYTNAGGSGLLWDDNYRPKLTPIAKHILDALASVGGDSQ